MRNSRSSTSQTKVLPVNWQDSAWLPRVIVRVDTRATPACEQRRAALRLPRLRFSPLAVFGASHPKSRPSPRITYHTSR